MNSKDLIIEKTDKMLEIGCFEGLKQAAIDWKASIGTDKEKSAADYYVKSLEQCILTTDQVIMFCESDAGIKKFGADNAKKYAAHGRENKKNGIELCDCSKCLAAQEVLKLKDDILA